VIEFDLAGKRMVLKLVYYGPALSGKTTNLLKLHDLLAKEGRGELMVLDTQNDRTIFFDLLPFFLVAPSGLRIKVKVYTVPGQVQHDATRKAVLQRADGVAFIADSRTAESKNNAESFGNLERNLSMVGIDIDHLPLVIQYNKRDLLDITPDEEIGKIWGPTGIPVVLSSALEGWGVVETFRTLVERVYDTLDRKHALGETHGLTRESFVQRLACRAE
jgi:signal recognition particle receptor subunit beta